MVLAQGNYVLAVSEGTYGGAPTSYYDLWRVENGKIAEHWDVMETIAEESTWDNENGKFQSLPIGNYGTILCVLHNARNTSYNKVHEKTNISQNLTRRIGLCL